jgi:hypothetical protein
MRGSSGRRPPPARSLATTSGSTRPAASAAPTLAFPPTVRSGWISLSGASGCAWLGRRNEPGQSACRQAEQAVSRSGLSPFLAYRQSCRNREELAEARPRIGRSSASARITTRKPCARAATLAAAQDLPPLGTSGRRCGEPAQRHDQGGAFFLVADRCGLSGR